MKIAIVTDAYFPHISGVASTLHATKEELERLGHEVLIFSPKDCKFTVPLLGYSEIKLAFFADRLLKRTLDEFNPDAIHISVEGPLGLAARSYCVRNKKEFSTAYHTRFPEYVHVRTGIPLAWSYVFLRWFHGKAHHVMVASQKLIEELTAHGFHHAVYWSRGVDLSIFNGDTPIDIPEERPIFMYMGRVAIEKNIEAFLQLDLPGTKYVVGDGPQRAALEKKYPGVVFTGYKFGKELASHLAAADVFVFPSKTDTLGLVMLEANACGLPIAAFPSQASETVIEESINGYVNEDLREACMKALTLSRESVRAHAMKKGWKEPTEQFLNNLKHV